MDQWRALNQPSNAASSLLQSASDTLKSLKGIDVFEHKMCRAKESQVGTIFSVQSFLKRAFEIPDALVCLIGFFFLLLLQKKVHVSVDVYCKAPDRLKDIL